MKKVLSVVAVLCFMSVSVFANPVDIFNHVMNGVSNATAEKYLKHFADDMGSVMTGSNFGIHSKIGFANLNLSLKLNLVNVDNEIMRKEGTRQLYVPIFVAAVGLISGFDLIGKYGYFYGSNLYGIGVRYKIYDSTAYYLPTVTVQGIYSVLNIDSSGNKVDNNNLALGAVASFPLPFVSPYVGIGFDRTKSEAKSSNKEGLSVDVDKVRYSLGVSINILVLRGSAGITFRENGVPSYHFSLSAGI